MSLVSWFEINGLGPDDDAAFGAPELPCVHGACPTDKNVSELKGCITRQTDLDAGIICENISGINNRTGWVRQPRLFFQRWEVDVDYHRHRRIIVTTFVADQDHRFRRFHEELAVFVPVKEGCVPLV